MTEFIQNTSVAETYRYIKEFVFSPALGIDPRTDIVFSDVSMIRLDEKDYHVRLRKQDDGYYSTDDDIWMRTWVTNPKALRKILMIQVFGYTPEYTYSQVRLYDGTDHLFWDDTAVPPAWVVAGDGDWNDEGTFNAHIQDFAILPDRRFAIVVNIGTTDRMVTPYISEIRVLIEIKIDYLEDIIFRSLIPLMKANILPLANYALPALVTAATEIDLNDYALDTPFNIVGIDAVYNFTTDPELLVNLFSAYNPSTKVITILSAIDAGEVPFIVFRYQPEIVYTTQQDYIEVSKLPSVVLQRLEVPLASSYNLAAQEGVVDKGTCNGVMVYEPWRATLEFRVHACVDRAVDQMRIMSAIMKFLDENNTIRSVGLDEYYQMQVIREFRDLISPNRSDELTIWTRFIISDVKMPFVSEDKKGVKRLILKFSEPAAAHEDPVKGGSHIVITSHTDDGAVQWEETFEITD